MRKLKNEELNRISIDEFKVSEKIPVVAVLDNVRSANNVGSVFRTSDALLVKHIYLCGITARPPHKDIQKTALGATESVSWSHHENTLELIHLLKQQGYIIIPVEQTQGSIMLNNFTTQEGKQYAFVFGNEVKGVAQNVIDSSHMCLEIPQYGTKHSFNISVCAGIVLWDIFNKLKH